MLTGACTPAARRFAAAAALGLLLAQSALAAGDTRNLISISEDERLYVLQDMRDLLATVNAVVEAAGANDMARLAASAKAAGMASTQGVPAGLPAKLPGPFKQMGAEMHRGFDQIAQDAQTLGDRDRALGQLARTLQLCVGCHAAYGFGSTTSMTNTQQSPATAKGNKP